MYKIKTFFKKLKKACIWWWFLMHETQWQEYDQTLRILIKQLRESADEFEKKRITTSALDNAMEMRLAAEYLNIFVNQKYETAAIEAAYKSCPPDMSFDEWFFMPQRTAMNEGWTVERVIEESKKDEKALELACDILKSHLPTWWQ